MIRARRRHVAGDRREMRLLAEGHTTAKAAARLYLSLRTGPTHRGRLRTKLGLETRAELSPYAQEHSLRR